MQARIGRDGGPQTQISTHRPAIGGCGGRGWDKDLVTLTSEGKSAGKQPAGSACDAEKPAPREGRGRRSGWPGLDGSLFGTCV